MSVILQRKQNLERSSQRFLFLSDVPSPIARTHLRSFHSLQETQQLQSHDTSKRCEPRRWLSSHPNTNNSVGFISKLMTRMKNTMIFNLKLQANFIVWKAVYALEVSWTAVTTMKTQVYSLAAVSKSLSSRAN